MNSKKIVIVDDDELVISALKTLLRLEGFSDANFFTNPLEALEYIKIEKPALILSDFMMGEMNGFEFLSHAKKLHPEISMILLTGYADKENAIRAINEVGLYKYIEKPWDNDDLIMNIRNGIERTDLISQLQQKVEELDCANQKLEKYSHNLEELVAEKTADLLSANSKLSGIFNYSADGIIIINEKTGIESVNPAAENIIGVAKESLIGMSFSNISNYKNKNEFKAALKEEPEILLKDCYILNSLRDKRIPVEINFAFIETDRREDIRHYVGIIRDI
ncbi:response regulator, partial [bacterium]|nr:response regulator [bacterium]